MRGAPKGHKKWGGRAKGTPNKKTVAVLEYCLSKGYDPIDAMIELTCHKNEMIAAGAKKELLQYCYPKRKSIEHSGEVEVIEPKVREESLEDRVKKIDGE